MTQKHVLITGCSEGGIGAAMVVAFQESGYHVFATARTLSKMAFPKDKRNITLLELDVTSSASINRAVDAVREKTDGNLDCLCNNAGALIMMPALDTGLDEGKKMFDVNLWGVFAMTKAFAPLLIEAKGTIANTGSISGYLNVPFASLYAASKSAVMTFSETIRLELAPFGVKVLTVVTGVVSSNLGSKNVDFKLPDGSLYAKAEKDIRERALGGGYAKMDAAVYAEKLVKEVLKGNSGDVWIGNTATLVKYAHHLPAGILVSNLLRVTLPRYGQEAIVFH